MAEEPMGLAVAEKFFGLLIVIIGIIVFYVTYTNLESMVHPLIFLAVGSVLIGLGAILVLSRPE